MITKFGVEIEFLGLGNDIEEITSRFRDHGVTLSDSFPFHQTKWTIKEDGSVYDQDGQVEEGAEIVSPPMILNKKNIEQIHKITSVLQDSGCYINNSCGLHVHVDARFLNRFSSYRRNEFFALIRELYAEYEDVFDERMHESRRSDDNEYCQSMIDGGYGRYFKVNIESFVQHGTIEFRHHHGTIDPVEIVNWVKTCLLFVEAARHMFREDEIGKEWKEIACASAVF